MTTLKTLFMFALIVVGFWALNILRERGTLDVLEKFDHFSSMATSTSTTTRKNIPKKNAPKVSPAPEPILEVALLTNDFASEIRKQVFIKTNDERVKNELPALSEDIELRAVALAHSFDMGKNNYFEHENLLGCDGACRLENVGYKYRGMGENIFWMKGYKLTAEKTAEMIVDGWMNSPGHRANILGKSWANMDIGIAVLDTRIYATALYSLQLK